jgi:RNA polymerase sigma-70 factor, ECF subfamily
MDPLTEEKIGSWFVRFRRGAVRRGVPDRHAKDVAQKTLLLLYQARAWLAGCENEQAASAKVALNEIRKYFRDEGRRGEVLTSFDGDDEIPDESLSPEDQLRLRCRRNLLAELLLRIPKKHRRLVIKHKLWGVPLAALASAEGVAENTMKMRVRRAMEHLLEAADEWQEEQRAQGHDGSACVPIAFDLFSGRWWKDALRNLGAKTVAQGAFVVLSCTLPSTDSAGPGAGSPLLATALHLRVAVPMVQDTAPADERVAPEARAASNDTRAPSIATSTAASWPPSAADTTVSTRELELITGAREAIEGHKASTDIEAQRLLDEHALEFPRGWLAAEREELLRRLKEHGAR